MRWLAPCTSHEAADSFEHSEVTTACDGLASVAGISILARI
jgi:hypothetical protein